MNRFENRRKRAQEEMRKKDVSALQVTGRENYYYLTGDIRNVARLFLPQEGEPTIIVFDEEVQPAKEASGISDVRGWRTPAQLMRTFFQVAKEHDVSDKKVGFCVHTNPGNPLFSFFARGRYHVHAWGLEFFMCRSENASNLILAGFTFP